MQNIPQILQVSLLSLCVACGGGGGSDDDNSRPPVTVNIAPNAVATADSPVEESVNVILDGSASNDPDGSIQSYIWSQTGGSPVVSIINANTAAASFIAPNVSSDTQLTFQLLVTDNEGDSDSDSVTVTINAPIADQPPTAVAPVDFSVIEASQVILDGSGSSDDVSIVSYSWQQTGGVPQVSLSDADQVEALFEAPSVDSATPLTFELTVVDSNGFSASDSVVVTIDNDAPPLAVAPTDFEAVGSSQVELDGSASSDDVGIVSYSWQQTAGESVTINNADTDLASFIAPAFNPDATSFLSFSLTVVDTSGVSHSDSVTVTIVDTPTDVTLSGQITFDKVTHDASSNGLDHTNTQNVAVRGAVVELLNAGSGAIIASSTSDENGDYSFIVAPNQNYRVRVRAQLLPSGGASSFNFRVVDNTNDDANYAMESSNQSVASNNVTLHLNAGSGWGGNSYTGPRVAGPFAILDAVYQALQKIVGVDADASFSPLNLHWSVNNINTGNGGCDSFDTGQIGTSFYTTQPGCAGIYILGDANSDTDEFDDHVIVHEWGHYFEDQLSRSDSIGGSHSGNDRLDMRVALGEGYGNALSGIVTDDPFYRDSFGNNQSQGFSINVEANPTTNRGWYSESSVQSLLYDLYDSNADGNDNIELGFEPIYLALVNGEKETQALTSVFSLVNQIKAESPANSLAIDALVATQNIIVQDDLGSGETNNGGDARNLPIYKNILLAGGNVQVCSFANSGQYNKLGNRQFLTFDLGALQTVNFTVTSSPGDDPDLILYQQGQTVLVSDEVGDESASASLSAGTYIIEVYEYNNIDTDAAGIDSCIQVEIN